MGSTALIHGDCLQEMKHIPDGCIDAIITDPPYGISFQSNYRWDRYDKIQNDNQLDWLCGFANTCWRITKNNSAHYVFCSFHHIDKFKAAFEKHFKIKNILVWEKNNTSMGDLKGDFTSKTEFILFIQKGRRLINGKRDPNIFKFARTGNKHRPTEKPVDLMCYLISKFTDEGGVVLDPFMGSGTTGVACKNTKRSFIGIEQDKKYFEIAQERIANEY